MESLNFTLFEILKYKIEFLELLEYSLLTYSPNQSEIAKHLSHLKSTLTKSLYKDILYPLFTSYKKVNKNIFTFLRKFSAKKITRMIDKKNLSNLLTYNECLIDCFESFNQIINSFIKESELIKKTDKRIIDLIEINSNHFKNFLFFNYLNYYISIFFQEEKIKHTKKDIKRIISVMKYCNKDNEFFYYMEALQKENEDKVSSTLKTLSNKCIELEKKQHTFLNNLINTINIELQNKNNK